MNPNTPTVRLRTRAVSDPAAKMTPANATAARRLTITAAASATEPTKLAMKSGDTVSTVKRRHVLSFPPSCAIPFCRTSRAPASGPRPRRRFWPPAGGGIAAALIGSVVAASAARFGDRRESVLALTKPVQVGHAFSGDDLQAVCVGADDSLPGCGPLHGRP
jgi:hypothetical protein